MSLYEISICQFFIFISESIEEAESKIMRGVGRKLVMSTNRARSRYGNEHESTLSRLILSDGFDLIKGQAQIKSQIDSTSSSTGAIVVYGGQGIMKSLNVGGDCTIGGDVSLSQTGGNIAANGSFTTDLNPSFDAVNSLGSAWRRWKSLQVNEITNTGTIKIYSSSTEPDVGVDIYNLHLSGPLTVDGPATFEADISVEGMTALRSTEVDTNFGDFNVTGSGNFNVISPYFNIQCDRMTLNCSDTINGVEICTNEPAVPFQFGSAHSICTFNGDLVIIRGDLQVSGTQTIINSQTVEIKDHQIVLGYFDPTDAQQASDATANGGGILLKGTTDKSITYADQADLVSPQSWVFSENLATVAGKHIQTDRLVPRDPQFGLSICDTQTVVQTVKNGMVGVGTENPCVTFQILGEDGIQIPAGGTAERPASDIVQVGMIRYNTDLFRYEGYGETGTWGSLGGVIDSEQTTFISVLTDDNITDAHKIRFFVKSSEIAVFDPLGRLGLYTSSPTVSLDITATDAIRLPVGMTSERPIGKTGHIRYNTDLHRYEGYNDLNIWSSLGGVIDLSQTTYISVLSDDGSSDVHMIRFFVSGTEVMDLTTSNATAKLGLNTSTPSVSIDVHATDAIRLPVGASAQRPAQAGTGMIRYNSDLHRYEGFNNFNVWSSLGGVIDLSQTTYISVLSNDGSSDVHKIRFFVSGTEIMDLIASNTAGRLGLNTSAPSVSIDINASDAIKLPVGSTSQRPDGSTGMIRYNSDLHRYEGFNDFDVWSTLGGVIDLSQTTYISVLSDDGSTDVHKVRFFVSGTEVMNLVASNTSGMLGLNTLNPQVSIDVNASDAIRVPVGSTLQRPTQLGTGMIRFNTSLHRFEGYNDANVWSTFGGLMDNEQTTYITVLSDDNSSDTQLIRFFTSGTQQAIIDSTGKFGLGPNAQSSRTARVSIDGNLVLGSDYCNSGLTSPINGASIQGQVGIGTSTPVSKVDVSGAIGIGAAYAGLIPAPLNGLIVQGAVGLGTATPASKLDISGSVSVGADYAGITAAPVNGLIVQGPAGFGTSSPLSTLDVAGGLSVGDAFAGSLSAPDNSLIVQTSVGIGTAIPVCSLDVQASDAIKLPQGSIAARPTNQELGMMRYNTTTNRFEGLTMLGTSVSGQQQWVSLSDLSNDDASAFISLYDANSGDSLPEIRFYTGVQRVDETVVSGMAMKIDQYGNVGIGGSSDRVLGSVFDVESQQNEQLALRYDDSNFMALTAGQHGDVTLAAYALDNVDYGDINLVPAGPSRQVTIGSSTDVFDPNLIPTKLSVYGYLYSSQGLKFPDGTIQTSSATQSSGGSTFGQWYLADVNSSTKKMYQPIDTTQVAIGTDSPTAKLTVAKVNGEADSLNHLELRYSNSAYATLCVDSTGTLQIAADLGQQSDILLSPSSFNVGINVQSALASLHVDNDIFAQASSNADNTSTPLGLYLRYYQSPDHSDSYGLISSGNNQTGALSPLQIQASQLNFQCNIGIKTTTPASTVGIGGSVAIGGTYGSTNVAPSDGLLVQGSTGIGTFSPQAKLDVTSTTSPVQIRANQANASSFGLVISNSSSSAVVTDGLRFSLTNTGAGLIDCATQGSGKSLVLQSSGGGVSIGGMSASGQMTVTQSNSASTMPVASLYQRNPTAPIMQFCGTSVVGQTTNTLVLNDANVTAAHIGAFVQVNVADSNGNVPSTPLYMPLYTLT